MIKFASKDNKGPSIVLSLCVLFLGSCALPGNRAGGQGVRSELEWIEMKENANKSYQLAQQLRMDLELIDQKLTKLEAKQEELNLSYQSLPLARMEEFENRLILLNEELIQQRKMIDGKAAMKTFSLQKKQEQKKALDQQPLAFRSAMKRFAQQEFTVAKNELEEFLKTSKDPNYRDDAYYWIGECHFQTGDYAQALSFYNKVFQFIQSDKADDSQFRIGQSYARMGDKNQAKAEFKKLEVLFPDSEYLKRVHLELKKL